MKRVISLTVALLLVLAVTVEGVGQLVEPNIRVTQNTNDGKDFIFSIEWDLERAHKGDFFIVQFPFPIQIDGKGIVEVEEVGNEYKLTFLDDYINIKGNIGGKQQTIKDNLDPLTINGKAIEVEYNTPEQGGEAGTASRDRIYKHGVVNGDIIDWEITINGDEQGVNPDTKVTDEIGKGHSLIKDSIRFHVFDTIEGQYNEQLVDMAISNVTTSAQEINFTINQLAPNEVLIVEYQTKITDKEQGEYENLVIVEDERKVGEKVITDSWGDIGGERPEKPTDPELPEKLPQVGESYIKIPHIIGALIVLAGIRMRR